MRLSPDPYLEKWSLQNPDFITESLCGHIYLTSRDNEKFILKIYNESGIEDEKNAAAFLKLCDGAGTIKLIEADSQALLLEYCEGPGLKSLVAEGRDDEASEIIVRILHDIHKIPIPENHDFLSFEQRLHSLFERANSEDNPSLKRATEIARHYLAEDKDITLLHGDMHHDNIMKNQRGWLAIDPKGLVGPRIYDAANILCNPFDVPNIIGNKERFLRQVSIIAEGLNVPQQKLINYVFIHLGLSISWGLEDDRIDDFFKSRLAMMDLVEPMVKI